MHYRLKIENKRTLLMSVKNQKVCQYDILFNVSLVFMPLCLKKKCPFCTKKTNNRTKCSVIYQIIH